ncbi:MAG: hypothetical protein AAB614_00170 [Patescibacteria group bacterium]
MEYDEVLKLAMKLGKERHPEAPQHHHAAFVNSVQTLVTGWSGGFGGPSMREHWACRVAKAKDTVGQFSFDDAVTAVEEACYGQLTLDHANMLEEEHCFDDAPGEVETAQWLLAMHHQHD